MFENESASLTCRLVLAASLSLIPTSLTAQHCLGRASFTDRRAQLGADVGFSRDARSFSGGIGVGSRSPFASVRFGTAYVDDLDDEATLFGAAAGISLRSQPKQRTQFCPLISALVTTGLELESGVRLSSQAFAFGISVGRAGTSAPWLQIVPFASGAVAVQTISIQFGSDGPTFAEDDVLWTLSLGAGFVVREVMTIRPSATMSIVEGRSSMSYGLHAAFGFGRVVVRPRPAEGEGSLTTVWVNTRARVYYCPGSSSYGATPYGTFMTERQALADGLIPVSGTRCE